MVDGETVFPTAKIRADSVLKRIPTNRRSAKMYTALGLGEMQRRGSTVTKDVNAMGMAQQQAKSPRWRGRSWTEIDDIRFRLKDVLPNRRIILNQMPIWGGIGSEFELRQRAEWWTVIIRKNQDAAAHANTVPKLPTTSP
jgi:hypothetical protein